MTTDLVNTRCFPALNLQALLAETFGLRAQRLNRLARGHTNASFSFTAADGRRFVLRQSWHGKPEAQIRREETVLVFLSETDLPVPHLVPTLSGQLHAAVNVNGVPVFFHLFRALRGRVRYNWHDAGELSNSVRHTESLSRALAGLHAALRDVPLPVRDPPLYRLRHRLDRLQGPRALPGPLELDLDHFCAGAERILVQAQTLPWETVSLQYCHGDYQLENILFEEDEVSGIVDFDSLMRSAPELDLAFALFSVSRARDDESFQWNKNLFHSCLRHYLDAAAENGRPLSNSFLDPPRFGLLKRLFCLDQALLHLECAQRGIWELSEGIGFLSCYRAVLGAS